MTNPSIYLPTVPTKLAGILYKLKNSQLFTKSYHILSIINSQVTKMHLPYCWCCSPVRTYTIMLMGVITSMSDKYQDTPIHCISNALGKTFCQIIPAVPSLTRHDSVLPVFGIEKKYHSWNPNKGQARFKQNYEFCIMVPVQFLMYRILRSTYPCFWFPI